MRAAVLLLVACGTRTGLEREPGVDASARPDAADASTRDAMVIDAPPIVIGNGCADGTREALTDETKYPRIAACTGTCAGYIDGASAATLCSNGWHVCRGNDVAVRSLRGNEVMFPGCYAYDAAQDCNYCSATCRGIVGDPNGACSVANDTIDADMAGLGSGCIHEPATNLSCLADVRLDASQGPGNARSFGCTCNPQLSGVICCAN